VPTHRGTGTYPGREQANGLYDRGQEAGRIANRAHTGIDAEQHI